MLNPDTGSVDGKIVDLKPGGTRPSKLGTESMHFLRLGFELLRYLRGHGGRAWIARGLLKTTWGLRNYSRHMQSLERLQMISRVGEPNMVTGVATTFELVWKEHQGAPVTELLDGLAAVMSNQEIEHIFAGRPKFIEGIKARQGQH